jgi:diaminopimelate epimerase
MARFLADLEGQQEATYRIGTGAGVIVPVVHTDGLVTVDMGPPELNGPKVCIFLAYSFTALHTNTLRHFHCVIVYADH